MKCLITGGAGFIGSNLAEKLIELDYKVTVVDDLSSGKVDFIPQGCISIISNFSDDFILKMIKNQEFDTVFHLAAKPRVSFSVEHPAYTTDINVNNTVKLMEACINNVNRFINTSSSAVYGNAFTLPTPESYPHSPQSPYALQKSVIEGYCKLFSKLYNLDTVSLRPFNVFGKNQLGDSPYACAVSSWLYAVKHNLPLRSDGSGEQSRDINHVDNVIDMFVKVANHKDKFNGDVFNAGSEMGIANNEILALFEYMFPDCKILTAPARPGDVMHTLSSMRKASNILSWKETTSFWDGLESTKNWALSNPLF
jgi:nucleoside-diphosphate-sugar epimerase